MTRYAVVLRGINVGGHRTVRMAALRELVGRLGYTRVSTLLQSGNVVFDAAEGDREAVGAAVEARIATELGLAVDVMVRTVEDLRGIVAGLPFPDATAATCAVAFLRGPVDKAALAGLAPGSFAPEEMAVGERELYLRLPAGLGRARLPGLVQRRLGVPMTIRNWSTTERLLALAEE
ncbi:DUF1697 domain-containing protein [Marinactinospora thermotolerans]|uniref:Uncharacterized conserved protein, DUF1697 family n=1 Tax=Marinactinospora thermotolerans DSM 45154 TaxID=1122192 RepID=A0A1T4RBL0_9ACTN|nr:DUF1697 domain-containing protein [Marinactinospora thermotolerans]SKA13452.1 Uncharacterized conserved protein, DUF1697 family [Marinactinospora thermotolerans DSM 45154]